MIRLLRARATRAAGQPCRAATAPAASRTLVTVRQEQSDAQPGPGGQAAPGTDSPGPLPAVGAVLPGPRRRWLARVPRWARWTAGAALAVLVFRRAAAWALVTGVSGALHLVGVSAGLPHIALGWPWSSLTGPATVSTVPVGPLVLRKIEGIAAPALGTTTFDFMFTRKASHSMGFLPCWYSATFYAVAKASATVDLNPGPAWWAPGTGHYALTVLGKSAGTKPGRVRVTITLPAPRLPRSVHDVSVDDTLSKPVSTDHSWTYPGLACGEIIRPQFTQAVLYAQAQQQAFTQATTSKTVTAALTAAAEKEAASIIGGNFVTPTLAALGYAVAGFTTRWAPAAQSAEGN